ncbi:hypothetical protein PLICRDRAFT_90158 [Plicaturopsis crispa FD-325 SS-3]|nr:hypothetical protein PLICRDRAFT_90158 [Plicaturopsis crispa FD-325 SS-3]
MRAVTESQYDPAELLTLPVELLSAIAAHLSRKDLKVFGTLSRFLRGVALPHLFESIAIYDSELKDLKSADEKIKDFVRKTYIREDITTKELPSYEQLSAFPYLRSMLCGFLCTDLDESSRATVAFERLSCLLDALRRTPLSTLIIYVRDTGAYAEPDDPCNALVSAESPLTHGLQGLKKLCVEWEVYDAVPGAQYVYTHLLALIHPSLSTLVHLELKISQNRRRAQIFDLTALRDVGPTLRVFRYWAHIHDRDALKRITEIFPSLEWLSLEFRSPTNLLPGALEHSCPVWEHEYVALLARLPRLVYFSSMHDMEHNADDVYDEEFVDPGDWSAEEIEWYVRCLRRRLEATRLIAAVCPLLAHCRWLQAPIDPDGRGGMAHEIVVRTGKDGQREAVVEGHSWMMVLDQDDSVPYWDEPTVPAVHEYRDSWAPPLYWS